MDRRDFLKQVSLLVAAMQAEACKRSEEPKPVPPPPRTVTSRPAGAAFSERERATLAAATERILPTDQDPGAKEANVMGFLDQELVKPHFAQIRTDLAAGALALDRRAARTVPGKTFLELAPEQKDEVLRSVQEGSARGADFVQLLVTLTLEGFLADPMYGGNQDRIGWQFIGYAPGHLHIAGEKDGTELPPHVPKDAPVHGGHDPNLDFVKGHDGHTHKESK